MKFLLTRISVLVAQLLFTYFFTEVYSSKDVGLLMFFQSSIALLLWLQLGLPQLITKSMLINADRSESWGYGEAMLASSLLIVLTVGCLGFYYDLALLESVIVVLNVLIISFINIINSYSRISGDFMQWFLTSSLHNIFLLMCLLLFKLDIISLLILLAVFNLFTLFYVYTKSAFRLSWAHDFRIIRLSLLQLSLNFGPSILVLFLRWQGMLDYGDYISNFQRELLFYSIIGIPINLLSGLLQPVLLDRRVKNGNIDRDFLSYIVIVLFVVMLLFDIVPAVLFKIDGDYQNILPISFAKVLVFVLPSFMLNITVMLIAKSKEYVYLLVFATTLVFAYLISLDTWNAIVWIARLFVIFSLITLLFNLNHSGIGVIEGVFIPAVLLMISFDVLPCFVRYVLLSLVFMSSNLRSGVYETLSGLIVGDYLKIDR